jgi:hypothetical protein
MRKGFQFLKTIQGVMFRVLEVQNWFASMIFSSSHQFSLEKIATLVATCEE